MKIEFTSQQVALGTITMPIAQILSLEALMNKLFEEGHNEGCNLILNNEDWHTVYSVAKLIGDSDIPRGLIETK